jgi:hypothetical protein
MARYSIMGRRNGGDKLIEICQVQDNPEQIAEAARVKTLLIDNGLRRVRIPLYEHVEIVDTNAHAKPLA